MIFGREKEAPVRIMGWGFRLCWHVGCETGSGQGWLVGTVGDGTGSDMGRDDMSYVPTGSLRRKEFIMPLARYPLKPRSRLWSFDTTVSTHAALQRGITELHRHRIIVSADTHTEAFFAVADMLFAQGHYVTGIYDRI